MIWSDVAVMKLELLPSQTQSWHLRKGQNRAAWFVQSTHSEPTQGQNVLFLLRLLTLSASCNSSGLAFVLDFQLKWMILLSSLAAAAADINFTKKTWEFEKNYHLVSQVSHWLVADHLWSSPQPVHTVAGYCCDHVPVSGPGLELSWWQ